MPRRHLIEIHEQPWCPASLRDATTDFLEILARVVGHYDAVLPQLERLLAASEAPRVVDLCSGAGGPWPRLLRRLAARRAERAGMQGEGRSQGTDEAALPELVLTDLFPHGAEDPRYHPEPVDARDLPAGLVGARTLFGSFHHFEPDDARAILEDAARARQPILIAEPQERAPLSFASIALLSLAAWLVGPLLRPWRLPRLLWTWPLPIMPLVLFVDGVVSCLRTYGPDELDALAADVEAALEAEQEAARGRVEALALAPDARAPEVAAGPASARAPGSAAGADPAPSPEPLAALSLERDEARGYVFESGRARMRGLPLFVTWLLGRPVDTKAERENIGHRG